MVMPPSSAISSVSLNHHFNQDCLVIYLGIARFEAPKNDDFKNYAQQLLGQGHHWMVLDLSGVHYLDSFGLATIISLLKDCRKAQGDLVLCGLNDMGLRLMTITRLDKVLTVWQNEEDAVKALIALKKGETPTAVPVSFEH
jgi:anti-anti-sigma factor